MRFVLMVSRQNRRIYELVGIWYIARSYSVRRSGPVDMG